MTALPERLAREAVSTGSGYRTNRVYLGDLAFWAHRRASV